MDSIDCVEEIVVSVVKVFVGVWDWQSWSDDEGEVSVDGDDVGLDCGEHHGEVGEIWVENPCVVGNVSAEVAERWRLEHAVVAHVVDRMVVGWRQWW